MPPCPIIINGRLGVVHNASVFLHGPDNILSIVGYDLEIGDIDLKTKSGEEVTLNINFLHPKEHLYGMRKFGNISTRQRDYQLFYHYGIIILYMLFQNKFLVICSEFCETIQEIRHTRNGVKILFKDGHDNNFIFTEEGDTYNLVGDDGETHQLRQITKEMPVFCKNGKMQKLQTKLIYKDNYGLLIHAEDDEYYSFNFKGAQNFNFSGDIFVLGDTVIFVCNNVIFGGIKLSTNPVTSKQFDDYKKYCWKLEIVKHTDHVKIDKIIISLRRWSHYIHPDGTILEFTNDSFEIYKYDGKYYNQCGIPLTVVPGKLPINDAFIVESHEIVNINGTFEINDKLITSEIAQHIENIELSEDFGFFDIIITMKSGQNRRGCYVYKDGPAILFEDGEVVPFSSPGTFYSKNGPYRLLAPTEYERLNCNLYKINGNLVIFLSTPELCEIYESFGEYLGKSEWLICIGVIAVHSRPKRTKPAIVGST